MSALLPMLAGVPNAEARQRARDLLAALTRATAQRGALAALGGGAAARGDPRARW